MLGEGLLNSMLDIEDSVVSKIAQKLPPWSILYVVYGLLYTRRSNGISDNKSGQRIKKGFPDDLIHES